MTRFEKLSCVAEVTFENFQIESGGYLKFEIAKELMDRCKALCSKYQQYLDKRREPEEELQNQKYDDVSTLSLGIERVSQKII